MRNCLIRTTTSPAGQASHSSHTTTRLKSVDLPDHVFEDAVSTDAAGCHKTRSAGVVDIVDSPAEAVVGVIPNEARLAPQAKFDLETIFHGQYWRIARVIA